jgi:hypothetical protein
VSRIGSSILNQPFDQYLCFEDIDSHRSQDPFWVSGNGLECFLIGYGVPGKSTYIG